jgi:serpin B
MRTQTILFFTFLLFVAFTSCNSEDNQDQKNIDLGLKSEQLIKHNNEFGLDLFQLIYADAKTPENFMISPLSVSMALSMAYNGAETETKDEMAKALRTENFTRDEMNDIYKKLIEELTAADPKVAMEIANSIWCRNGYQVQQSYLDVNKTYYNAEVEVADFADPNTLKRINQWASDKTHEKIPHILDEISSDAVMFLMNAIYFKGNWAQEFNKESTQELGFNVGNDEYVQTPMMGRVDTLNYLSNETFSAIELPYGKGNFNMMVMLPNYDKSVEDVVTALTPENWAKWQSAFKITNGVDIRLPKFKVEYEVMLNKVLQAMGMELAFTEGADFSGINPARDLFISFVKHKTFVEVDEKGTEAAAVTIIGFETTSFDPDKPQKTYFHCDRPFLFAITEKETGTILFMGKIGNPTL